MNFRSVAELTRSIAFYLNSFEMISDPSERWLNNRISDTSYYLSDMRLSTVGSEVFHLAEIRLIEILKFISEYYEENGCINLNMIDSNGIAPLNGATAFRPPARWLAKYSEKFDDLE
jgi:hypothetical protein